MAIECVRPRPRLFSDNEATTQDEVESEEGSRVGGCESDSLSAAAVMGTERSEEARRKEVGSAEPKHQVGDC